MSEMTFGPIFIGMNYLIYKITNKLDNKIYVGKHKTDFMLDDYFGSGLLLGRAIEKHGRENFTREILFECKTEEEMNQKEADIVDEDFIARDDTYNIMPGGNGGFSHINKNGLQHKQTREYLKGIAPFAGKATQQKRIDDENFRREYSVKVSNGLRKYYSENKHPFQGKEHSEETKQKMRDAKKGKVDGKNNPSYGKHWMTNGTENKLVKKEDVPSGWRKGRV